jgi:fucose permease
MHWLHACYGIGITTGPFLMTAGLQTFGNWRPGYLIVGSLQLLLAMAFALSMSEWKKFDATESAGAEKKLTDYDTPVLKTLMHPQTWFGILLFFFYSGAEVALGFWAYTILTEARGIIPAIAGILAGSYYAMFTIGRIISGIYSKYISADKIVFISIFIAIAGSFLLWLNINPVISLIGMIVTGFAIAPVFPSLVSGTSKRVGKRHASNAIGMQMSAAAIGSACMPALMGIIARNMSVEAITAALVGLFFLIALLFIISVKFNKQNVQNFMELSQNKNSDFKT